jgi:hypothetical protein
LFWCPLEARYRLGDNPLAGVDPGRRATTIAFGV